MINLSAVSVDLWHSDDLHISFCWGKDSIQAVLFQFKAILVNLWKQIVIFVKE